MPQAFLAKSGGLGIFKFIIPRSASWRIGAIDCHNIYEFFIRLISCTKTFILKKVPPE